MEKEYCVYKHTTPNGKIYIGITCQNPVHRWGKDGKGYKHNRHFYNAITKYGWNNITHEILHSGLDAEQAGVLEQLYIAIYESSDTKKGYNNTSGGQVGFHLTTETKKKLSRNATIQLTKQWEDGAWREKMSSNASKQMKEQWKTIAWRTYMAQKSEERWSDPLFREKVRNALNTTERKSKISASAKKMWSDEAIREKITQSLKESWQGEKAKKRRKNVSERIKQIWQDEEFRNSHVGANSAAAKSINQYDLDGNFIRTYDCISEAGQAIGKNIGHIVACAKGKRKTAYGYIWKYARKEADLCD